jgi:hypothetical protein
MSRRYPLRAALRAVIFLLVAASAPAQITESPYTIKPGRFQLRFDAVELKINDEVDGSYSGLAAGRTLLTIGVTNTFDFQIGADLFVSRRYTIQGDLVEKDSGFGDLYGRFKWTVWRDDEVGAALALLPYAKIPTNSGGVGNDSIEGGLMVPVSWDLIGGFQGGAMFQWDLRRNDADNGYDSFWFISATARKQVFGALAFYGELTTSANSAGFNRWTGSFGGGATLRITSMLQLDYSIQRGIGSETDDWVQRLRVNWDF